MHNVYKVTAAKITKTKNGYELYNLELNKSIQATKLVPLKEMERNRDPLYKLYEQNNRSLHILVGRYIATHLEESEFGKRFSSVDSLDVLQDFKSLLEKSNGKAFSTNINIFNFLKERGYPLNPDGSITLKAPHTNCNIKPKFECIVCYPNNTGDKTLTLDNIEEIYERFYKGISIDNGNPDRDEQYQSRTTSIVINRRTFHKSKGGVISDIDFDVLRIGDALTEEQWQFLSSNENKQQ